MSDFDPFANDAQVVTFTTGDDELSLENGEDEIVLSGSAVFSKTDPQAKLILETLLQELQAVLAAMG